jgi:hypothetical protein
LLEIGDTIGIIPGTTICGLADGAAWPMKMIIRKFRGEFEDYVRQTNPEGYMSNEPVAAMQLIGIGGHPTGTNHRSVPTGYTPLRAQSDAEAQSIDRAFALRGETQAGRPG